MKSIIDLTVSAAPSEKYYIKAGDTWGIRITGDWAAGEFADIQYYAAPNDPRDYFFEGVQQRLHNENQHILITGPFEFILNKQATAAPTGADILW